MDKMKIAFILILNCLIIIGTTCFAATGIVNAPNGLVLRKEAAKGAEPVTTVSDKANVEVIEQNGEWYKVKYNGNEGYLFAEYVDVEEEKADEEETEKENQVLAQQEEAQKSSEEKTATEENTNNEAKTYPKKQNVKEAAKIYLMPSVTARIISNVEKDKEVTINYEVGNWINITYENTEGWARKHFVIGDNVTTEENVEEEQPEETDNEEEDSNQEEKTVENKKGYIDVSNSANVRKDASTSAEVVNTLLRNTEVTIVGEKGDFYKIEYQNITGYISKSLISDKPLETVTSRSNSGERKTSESNSVDEQSTSSSSSSSTGSGILATAKNYLGYSYSYGGSSPSTGFDCSGFAQYVYSANGYSIGRTCTAQLNYGTAVSKSELQEGDLVFFNNTGDGSVGHVGIYAGNGTIIHSSNPRTGVKTDTINSGYYSKYYYTARRIAK